jgi:formiminotetrahydrofolate cyclodeaminase
MTLAALPLTTFLERLRSSSPTPGGGSASALAGALGASLLAMVAALPKARTTTDEDVRKLKEAGAFTTTFAQRLESLIDEDSGAYDAVVSAYRLPKETDAEKSERSARIQEAMKQAIEAPLEVMRTCADALALAGVVSSLGNANASSDVQVGIKLLRAGLRGARLNVHINLGSIKDRTYAAEVEKEVAVLGEFSESGGADAPTASA